MTIIGESLETPVTPRARVDTDRQRHGVNHLDGVRALPAALDQQPPDGSLDVPQAGRLPHEGGPVFQLREEMPVVAAEVIEEVLIQMEFEISAADFHRDDLLIRQRGEENRRA